MPKKIVQIIKKVPSKKVTAKTLLAEILEMPQGGDILAKYKVPCLTCPMAQYEMQDLKIGDVCKMYGLDLKRILVDLNK
ncbi:MAG: hypothetical protein NTV62_04150 [Candidatus Gribaldobacteria bacterium]|nr:hypothetical protein [Candidatus Gribaldobacteria bacterium]